MGKGFTMSCSECEYRSVFYLGVGFSYPYVYASTLLRARRGHFGKELKKVLKAHPDAAIDSTLILTNCPNCHALGREENLCVYLPKSGYDRSIEPKRAWSSVMPCQDVDYISPTDLDKHYTRYHKYAHKCKQCGSEVETINENEVEERVLPCPNCGAALKVSQNVMWD